jgi:hypothetical protein
MTGSVVTWSSFGAAWKEERPFVYVDAEAQEHIPYKIKYDFWNILRLIIHDSACAV